MEVYRTSTQVEIQQFANRIETERKTFASFIAQIESWARTAGMQVQWSDDANTLELRIGNSKIQLSLRLGEFNEVESCVICLFLPSNIFESLRIQRTRLVGTRPSGVEFEIYPDERVEPQRNTPSQDWFEAMLYRRARK